MDNLPTGTVKNGHIQTNKCLGKFSQHVAAGIVFVFFSKTIQNGKTPTKKRGWEVIVHQKIMKLIWNKASKLNGQNAVAQLIACLFSGGLSGMNKPQEGPKGVFATILHPAPNKKNQQLSPPSKQLQPSPITRRCVRPVYGKFYSSPIVGCGWRRDL